jgi:hypothetical protein
MFSSGSRTVWHVDMDAVGCRIYPFGTDLPMEYVVYMPEYGIRSKLDA